MPVTAMLLLAIGWWIYLFVSYYPGGMSTDSFYIMQQARDGQFKDDHPPLMAMTWWVLAHLSSGQAIMLALNLILFWGGAVCIFAALALTSSWMAVVGMILFALQPAMLGILGVVWIDIFMAGMLMMAAAGLALATVTTGRQRTYCVGLALFFSFLAVGARHNCAAAVAPLIAFSLMLASSSCGINVVSLLKTSVVALALSLLAFFAWGQISKQVTPTPNNMVSLLAMYDIAGIASNLGEDIPELASLKPLVFADVITLYSPRSVIPLQVGKQVHATVPAPTSGATLPVRDSLEPERKKLLKQNWLSAIWNHPAAYIAHRSNVFSSLIGLPPWKDLWLPVFSAVFENDLGIEPRLESTESSFLRYIRSLSYETYLFYPAIYLLAAIFLFPSALVIAVRRDDWIFLLSATLFLSGIAHMTGLFFIAMSGDFRYSHWLIASTWLGFVIFLLGVMTRLIFRDKPKRQSRICF